jgi:hypothetical protein
MAQATLSNQTPGGIFPTNKKHLWRGVNALHFERSQPGLPLKLLFVAGIPPSRQDTSEPTPV